MEGGRGAICTSDGDEKEGAWRGASRHADQHGQSGVDVQESRAMEGGRGARRASDGDEEHPDTLNSMINLALTYKNQGRWKEAEELFVQVMETSLRVLGQEHPDTLNSMANLASTYRNQGR